MVRLVVVNAVDQKVGGTKRMRGAVAERRNRFV